MQTTPTAISTLWPLISTLGTLRTPSGRSAFQVVKVGHEQLKVAFGKSQLSISRASFEAALNHLHANGHYAGHPCVIGADNEPAKAGPLCLASRRMPSGTYGARNITYILPILAHFGIAAIGEGKPSTVWLTDTHAGLTEDQQAFACHLSSLWDGAEPGFAHRYGISRHRVWSAWRARANDDAWWCSNLSQAAQHYAWPELDPPNDFASLSITLRKALDDNDDSLALSSCKKIFRWGGVARKPSDPSLLWVCAQADAGTLCDSIRRAVSLLKAQGDGALTAFDGDDLLMNSAMTKVYTAADPGSIIMYDGRVGAALGLLARSWLSANQRTAVPAALAFRWGPNIKTAANPEETRNPSVGDYRFASLYTQSADRDQRWATLVRLSSRILRQAVGNVASRGVATTLTDWERALFMIGYDVRADGR
ncbi:hypothetical protein F3J44_14930 [Pantoea sp. Tr-811]|uniref:hypothetical protein n=1 Tax=Pantoea sp. Tr-811 TaxID=2608361 RepID=UPI00141DFA73|nr:hypothetical protein [Pantoea sp. Tr-811]NIF27662.1 hypothetical protein [Pantoea sp. Tr-811]